MILAEKLLPRLGNWKPTGSGRHSLTESFPETGWGITLAADAVDSLSCLVWELTLMRTGQAPVGATLQAWAAAIADRSTGLMEPLKVHEVDTARSVAFLRSEAPARKGEALAYYEVQLHGLDKAVVRRFTALKGTTGRDQIAYALTHEVIAKLCNDIAG